CKGPCLVWDKEGPEEKREMDLLVAEEQEIEKEKNEIGAQEAAIPGTTAFEKLATVNEELSHRHTSNGRRWPRKSAKQFFKAKTIKHGDRLAGGID
ncbi:hypothetical protein RUND412_010725, partial [Rhizina undulata]